MSIKFEVNPERYRKLSKPFASVDDKDEALHDFYEMVKSAREKCELPDVVVLVKYNYKHEDGGEAVSMSSFQYGNEVEALNMLGYGYADALEIHRKFLEHISDEAGCNK